METALKNHHAHSLGSRAFFLFFTQKLKGPLLLFALAVAAWYGERWLPPGGDAAIWGSFAVNVLFLTAAAYTILLFLLTYLSYRVYTYAFAEEAFIITSGLATRKEIAALYHQIQNVNINRSVSDRLTGVSQIVIFMTGNSKDAEHARLVLPAIAKRKARIVQKELLARARRHVPPAARPEE